MNVSDFLSERFSEVSPMEFYRDLFPAGCLDVRGAMTKGKYCGIAVQVSGLKARRFTICDDLEPLPALLAEDEFCVISPVAYAGRTQAQKFARELYSMTFDLDGLIEKDGEQVGLDNLVYLFDHNKIPRPTYLVSSGTGVHCYYVLDKPLKLYKNVLEAVGRYRQALTTSLWASDISELWSKPQFESTTQSFRAVGSICKDGKSRVRAFLVGDKVSVDELNGWVEKIRPDLVIPKKYASKMTIEEAKEKYPEWYESRIVAGKSKGHWTAHRGLYDWWIEQLKTGANRFPSKDMGVVAGHRYFGIMALAIYAVKSGVSREELEKDALSLVPLLDSRTDKEDNHFDASDVMKAIEAYSAEYITFPIDSISSLTNIDIKKNKRNGRKRKDHLFLLNGTNRLKRSIGEQVGGKRSAKGVIRSYIEANPDASVRQTAEALGLSPSTVQRWRKLFRESGESS